MPRRNIKFSEGNYYHVYNRGAHKQKIFYEKENYIYLLDIIKKNARKFSITIVAYCLMPNHYHLLLQVNTGDSLPRFISNTFNSYVQALNKKYHRSGALFARRFKAIQIEKEDYLVHLCKYIHRNPIEAGLASDLKEWPFSNYLDFIGLRNGELFDQSFFARYFSNGNEYESFVADKGVELPELEQFTLDSRSTISPSGGLKPPEGKSKKGKSVKPLSLLSATELRKLIQSNDLTPVEVVEAALQQVDRCNDRLNAIVTLNESALDEARALQNRKGKRGLLHGLPVGIKDVTPVAGLKTTFGSLLFKDHVPAEDALIVQRLKQAGAIIIGKTNTPEFAAGGHTWNDVFGVTRNPWNPDLSPGGSTGGGAVALATGMIVLSDGTDLGGSLRIPASFCGVSGLRPSPGLVPKYPSEYLWDDLHVAGPMGRTIEDVALMLQVISGPSSLTPLSQSAEGRDFMTAVQKGIPKGTKVAYCQDVAGIGIDAGIGKVCRDAAFEMKQVDVEVKEIHLDLSFAKEAFITLRGYNFVSHFYQYLDKIDQFGVNIANNLKAGLKLKPEDFAKAEQSRTRVWTLFRDLFTEYDFLLTPCIAVPPFPVEQNYPETIAGKKMETYVDWIAPTSVLSLTSLPVAAVPCGLDGLGLPAGMQIVGKPMGEEHVLAFAKVFQDAFPIGLPELSEL